ncbi:unnamed protein product [Phytomonas sp. Hart1]|nr:unnamed protein product [Phytomonas sp. Hart1]|eukprot:CCW69505.1 unnamed protein product [Phytomonas sp. isolate Hart1]
MSNDLGIIGLGVMGANLALNIAEKGFHVAVYNRTASKTVDFITKNIKSKPFDTNLHGFDTLGEFVKSIKTPRKIFILVQAGAATTETINNLREVLSPKDIIIDTGNANFKDQGARAEQLEKEGLRFMGIGISGGEEGARKGPAFFPGGTPSTWGEVRPIVEAAAAKAEDNRPCVTFNGRGGAGSCVKMYHNAGEYAILQIWGEIFSALRAMGLTNDEIGDIFEAWKAKGFLKSYMLDISIAVCRAKEEGNYLTEKVKDRIGSKGTGLWSVQEALEVGVPAPSLAMAVISRQLTMYKEERIANAANIPIVKQGSGITLTDKSDSSAEVRQLYHAACLSIIASYAQMFQCLRDLDKVYDFGLNLPATIATFRAGCILQGHLLQPMTEAFEKNPNLSNLMCHFKKEIMEGIHSYRSIMGSLTANTSIALPVMSASLNYINAMFTPLLQYGQIVSLQRDVFGRHGYERLDKPGSECFTWPELQ